MSKKLKHPLSVRSYSCKHKCDKVEGYVGLKTIKFGVEMGYKKCVVCECHFLYHGNITRCQCCNLRLRSKMPRRKVEVKEKAEKFLMEISVGK